MRKNQLEDSKYVLRLTFSSLKMAACVRRSFPERGRNSHCWRTDDAGASGQTTLKQVKKTLSGELGRFPWCQ